MSAMAGNAKIKKVMTQPINLIFRFLQNRTRIKIWLYDNAVMSIEGRIVGFDEYMNLVLDDAAEIDNTKKTEKRVGRILLKGDTIALMQTANPGE
mmetsp:Transcript_13843/g.28375  ORF Transcript_13843/g.28375 Transcript_13843/m.28375 type:complete len:95 (+) Transcript_13843:35-319(+)